MTTSGRPGSPTAGSATSASSGTPSKVLTRVATVPGQNRTPSCGTHAWVPNGVGAAAAFAAGTRNSTRAASKGRVRRRMGATTRFGGGTCEPERRRSGPAGSLAGRRCARAGGGGGRRRAHAQREDRDVVARRTAGADGRVVDRI